ncbi:MAG TPA: sugar transferase [Solirubrobacteraceae bacterium]|jgi:lipopolysaccharide/colanic/teichoic acid biosynthesis glycosyltransferase|nr:sugar transferase [Solirubrobacteraceae bacterium]
MALQETARPADEEVAQAAAVPHAGRSRLARRSRIRATEWRTELVSGSGHIHAGCARPGKRDRFLVLVAPGLLDDAGQALGTDADGAGTSFAVGHEPAAFRALLGASVREVLEAHGVRRVLIAPSGQGAEEHMLELRVDSSLRTATVSMPRLGLTRPARLAKRAFDVLVAIFTMVLAAPLLALIALLIKVDSPGPVLFRQTRVGRGGRPFSMLKFRTMVEDAEAQRGGLEELNERDGLFKIREDPRVTPIGRWLRQTNLDELPQLANVLRAQMSLVGPRPLVPDEDALILGWRRRRLAVSPGMTGYWQVGRSRVSLDEMVVIDHLYAANWSLWRDVKCLVGTVPSMVLRRGL